MLKHDIVILQLREKFQGKLRQRHLAFKDQN